jgi:TRAP-type C4-dicarboxylate transport system permease small subunit
VRMAGAPLPQSSAYLPLCAGGALMVVFALSRLHRALRPGGEG